MADVDYEDMLNDEPFGYCYECHDPIEHHHERHYDEERNLYCSEDCKRESSSDRYI